MMNPSKPEDFTKDNKNTRFIMEEKIYEGKKFGSPLQTWKNNDKILENQYFINNRYKTQ